MSINGFPWTSQISIAVHGSWKGMAIHGYPCLSLCKHGFPWIAKDFDEFRLQGAKGAQRSVAFLKTDRTIQGKGFMFSAIEVHEHPCIIHDGTRRFGPGVSVCNYNLRTL